MSQIKRVLVLPDTQIYESNGHVDGLDLETWEAVKKLIRDYKWSECVQIGDFMDFNCISSHNIDNLRAVEGQRIQKDYWAGNKILDELQEALGRAKLTIIEGNHEHRMERMIDKLPVLEGSVEIEQGLRFEKRKINYVKGWSKGSIYRIGKASFFHGMYTNDHHAKKTVTQYGTNIFYGHTHDVQSYSQVLRGKDKTIIGQSLGCLCKYDLPYMRGRPSKWQQAVTVFEFFPDGFFTYQVIGIYKHRFLYNGKVYKP